LTKDCQHGLPTALDFINSSMVTFSSTAIGEGCNLQMNAKYMVAGSAFGKVNKNTGVCTVHESIDLSDNYAFAS